MLIAKNISKKYRGNRSYSLVNFSYAFQDSGLYLITGPSGSGKSTLLGILSGIDDEYEGTLYFDSKVVSRRSRTKYLNYISSIVFQEINFVDHLSIEENLKIAFELKKDPYSREKCLSILHEVNLPDDEEDVTLFLSKKPTELSGGQKQRLAIARAMIKRSEILFLDEPTSALDKENAEDIIRILYELSKTTLIIVVSHTSDYFYGDSFHPTDVISIVKGKAEKQSLLPDSNSDSIESDLENKHISALSHKTALTIGTANIATSKLRLFLSSLMTVFSLVSFMFLFSARHINRTDVLLEAQQGIDQSITLIYNNSIVMEQGHKVMQRVPFSSNQQKLLVSHQAHNVFSGNINLSNCIDEKLYSTLYSIPLLNYTVNGTFSNYFMELWKEDDANFEVDTRVKENPNIHFPSSFEEIAIPSILADAILHYGFKTNGFEISDVNELIGKKINRYSICNIYTTKDYETLKKLEDTSVDEEERLSLSHEASYSQLLYVAPDFFENWMASKPYTSSSSSSMEESDQSQEMAYSFYAFEDSEEREALNFTHSLNLTDSNIQYQAGIINLFSSRLILDQLMETEVAGYFSYAILALVLLSALSLIQMFSSNIKKEQYCFGVLLSLGCGSKSLFRIMMEETLLLMIAIVGATFLFSWMTFLIYDSVIALPLLNFSFLSVLSLFGIVLGIGVLLTLFGTIKASKTNIRVLLTNRY